MDGKQPLFNTKDYVMLVITLGGVIVSITAWGYSLKGSIDLSKQSIDQLVVAQKEANDSSRSLTERQTMTEKDVVGIKKDVEFLQKKSLSYNNLPN